MGRELHDSTAQSLVALQLKILYLKEMFEEPHHRNLLAEVEEMIHELHGEIRAVSFMSTRPLLTQGDLPVALRTMAARFGELTGLRIVFRLVGTYVAGTVDTENSVYRVAQEALANVYRHARASDVDMALESTSECMRLVVEDNGVGFDRRGKARTSGMGLDNIAQRARELGGSFDFRRLKRSTRCTVAIPRAWSLDVPPARRSIAVSSA